MSTTANPPVPDRRTYDGKVEVCCHRVTFYYDIYNLELTDEQKTWLTEEAERRAKECITDGCHSGQLVCCLGDYADTELLGWWQIASD